MSNAMTTLQRALVANCIGEALVGDVNGQRLIRIADLPELFSDIDDDALMAAAVRSINGEVAERVTLEIVPEDGAIYLVFDEAGDAA